MTPSQRSRLVLIFSLLTSILVSDQFTKWLVREKLGDQSFSYLGDTVRLQLAENSGAFLSLGADLNPTARFLIFTVGISIFVLGALWFLIRKTNLTQAMTIAYTLVVAGGIGNLIDRAMKGTVTDFMNIGIGPVRTGVFNIADVAIMVAVGVLFVFGQAKRKSP